MPVVSDSPDQGELPSLTQLIMDLAEVSLVQWKLVAVSCLQYHLAFRNSFQIYPLLLWTLSPLMLFGVCYCFYHQASP